MHFESNFLWVELNLTLLDISTRTNLIPLELDTIVKQLI